MTIDEEQSPI